MNQKTFEEILNVGSEHLIQDVSVTPRNPSIKESTKEIGGLNVDSVPGSMWPTSFRNGVDFGVWWP